MLKWLLDSASDPTEWLTTCAADMVSKEDADWERSFSDDGISLLHLAADEQQISEYLLQQGIFTDVNIRTRSGRTPLHYAASRGSSSCCQVLLDHGAELTSRDEDGKLPIEYALDRGDPKIVKLLLRAGSPLPPTRAQDVGDMIWGLSVNEGLEIARNHYFEKAILAGNLEQCKAAVGQGCSLDNPLPSCHRCTPLFAAIRADRADVVEWLLQEGASPLGVFCHHNIYPEVTQHAASNLSSSSCMDKVLSAALQHGICWYPMLTSPIYLAVERDEVNILQTIISHIKQNITRYHHVFKPHLGEAMQGDSGRALMSALINQPDSPSGGECRGMPLHCAASVGNIDALNLLILNGADVDALDQIQRTPLIVASGDDQLHIVRALLANGAAIECRASHGYTAMALAVRQGHLDIVQELDSKCSFSLNFKNVTGENLTSLASLGSSPLETFKYLISRGVDPQERDRQGCCGLSLALNHLKLRDYVVQSRLAASQSVSKFYRPDNPFALAAAENATNFLKRIYRSLPRVTAQMLINRDGWSSGSPLCDAAARNHTSTVELLLSLQANIEQDGSSFGTPLMCAIACGNLDMVKLLVRRGANLEYTDENGTYRSGFLASLPHPKVTKWLLVGRYQDQNKLTNNTSNENATFRRWSGKRAVEVALKSWQQRRWDESTLDFLIRLQRIKKEFAGQRAVGELV